MFLPERYYSVAMQKHFNVNDDIHWLYVPSKLGGRGLLSVEDVVNQERCALGGYLKSSVEPCMASKSLHLWRFCNNETFLISGSRESRKIKKLGSTNHNMASFFKTSLRWRIRTFNGNSF